MNAYLKSLNDGEGFCTPNELEEVSELFFPTATEYKQHPFVEQFGCLGHPRRIFKGEVEFNGLCLKDPMLLPVEDRGAHRSNFIWVQDSKTFYIPPEFRLDGVIRQGDIHLKVPIILAQNWESFNKVSESISLGFDKPAEAFSVVSLVSNSLFKGYQKDLLDNDYKRLKSFIDFIITKGHEQIYLVVRSEQLLEKNFQKLLKETQVKVINQSIEADGISDIYELYKEDNPKLVQSFIIDAINKGKADEQINYKWDDIIPLKQSVSKGLLYPIHAFPETVQEAIKAIAEHVQVPVSMAAQCVLGTMSHIAQQAVNAPNPSRTEGEPCSLYLMTEGQSGSRKSSSRELADRPIIEHERKAYEVFRSECESWKSLFAGLDKKERTSYIESTPEPRDPSTRFADATLEPLAGLYIDGIIKNASISSDEAGQFFGGHTMRGETRNSALGAYTKLFDDGSVERTRAKSNLNGSGRAYDVRLTFNLQGQREVLSDALKDPVLIGQGFLPRFLLNIPENLAGTRLKTEIDNFNRVDSDARLLKYWGRCESLLGGYPKPLIQQQKNSSDRFVIAMSKDALCIDFHFYNETERLQGKGQLYEYLQPFASRASQIARRIATVITYFEGLIEINEEIMLGACDIVRHSLNEWLRYVKIEKREKCDAERLMDWIIEKCQARQTDRLHYSYIQTSAPRPMQKNNKLLEMVLDLLEDSNYIRIEHVGRKRFIVSNPKFLTK